MIDPYKSGADMWYDYLQRYGEMEARGICNRYLDMQIRTTDPEELQFCRELYAAIPKTLMKTEQKSSILDDLSDKKKAIQENINITQEKKNERSAASHL